MILSVLFSSITSRLSDKFSERESHILAYLLIKFLYGKEKYMVIAYPDEEIAVDEEELSCVIGRLLADEPVEYIVGEVEFYGCPFCVNRHTLIPRPETEELVDWVIREYRQGIWPGKCKILDIGTGSGAIALSLARNIRFSEVIAYDVSEEALKVAQKNAVRQGVNNISFEWKDILAMDILPETFDIIVSNPPYVLENEKQAMQANVLEYEPPVALFVKDAVPLLFYEKIAALALSGLTDGGRLYFEINERFGMEMIRMLEKKGFSEVVLQKDLFGKDRMIRAIKNG